MPSANNPAADHSSQRAAHASLERAIVDEKPLLDFDPRPPQGAKARVVRLGLQSLGSIGLCDLAERVFRNIGATILMYHSVADDSSGCWIDPRNHLHPLTFQRQMTFLARRRCVLSLSELVDRLKERRAIPPSSVVITFDDGYLDNLSVAAPVLEDLELPATLFVPTGVIDRAENQWVDRLYAMFRARTASSLKLVDKVFDLAETRQALDAYRQLCRRMLVATHPDREALLSIFRDQLRPHSEPPRLTLTWDEIRQLSDGPFEIGAHTVGHTDLRTHTSSAATEAVGSRDTIAREVGSPPRHFSFPYGRSDPISRQAVIDAGFDSAVSDSPLALITRETDIYAMPRIEPPPRFGEFRARTSGLFSRRSRHRTGSSGVTADRQIQRREGEV